MDAQQELFTRLLVKLRGSEKRLEAKAYDGKLPPSGTPYPFIYLGNSQSVNNHYKNAIFSTVTQTIDVFSNNLHQRGRLSWLISEIIKSGFEIEDESDRAFLFKDSDYRILPDNTTEEPLLHAVITLTFECF